MGIDVNGRKFITRREPPALLGVCRYFYNEALPLFLRDNKFHVVANGTVSTGTNMLDFQNAVEVVIHQLQHAPGRPLTLFLQDSTVHGSIWQHPGAASASIVRLAHLVLAGRANVTINSYPQVVLRPASQLLTRPTVNIMVHRPVAALSLRVIFHVAISYNTVPAPRLPMMIFDRAMSLRPPTPATRPSMTFSNHPHGLAIQGTNLFILPHEERPALNMARDLYDLGEQGAHIKWLRLISRSMKTHRRKVKAEINRLGQAWASDLAVPPGGLAAGEGFDLHTRTIDSDYHALLPVYVRLGRALDEMERTKDCLDEIERLYLFERAYNSTAGQQRLDI